MSTRPLPPGSEVPSLAERQIAAKAETPADLPPEERDHGETPGTADSQDRQRTPKKRLEGPENSKKEPPQNAAPKVAPPKSASPAERHHVQVYTEETFGQKLSHWGPTVASAASLFLTIFVWQKAQELNKQQIDLQKQQTEIQNQQKQLQSEQVQAELADMRSKFFDDLTATDERKKTAAELGLAGHGRTKAMQVVRLALGVEQTVYRDGAINVVYRLFQAEMEPGRKQLLDQLKGEFASPNKTLRWGVVQSLVKLQPLLNQDERRQVTEFLHTQVVPWNICSDEVGRGTVQEAANFSDIKDAEGTKYLMEVARCPKCGDGWLQAMIKLGNESDELPVHRRVELKNEIDKIREEVLGNLKKNIDAKDLAKGSGFEGFMPEGRMGADFESFKHRVEREFDRVIQSLNSPEG